MNKWVKYAPYMMTEYLQCVDEGREVLEYKDIAEQMEKDGSEDKAEALGTILTSAPVLADYDYKEPSDYDGICRERPHKRAPMPAVNGEKLPDKIKGAWTGRVAGCLLGKPVEGFLRGAIEVLLQETDDYPLSHYISSEGFDQALKEKVSKAGGNIDMYPYAYVNNIDGCFPPDDDINYTVLGLAVMEIHGPEFTPEDMMNTWLGRLPYLCACTAERTAYKNAAAGIAPPDCATYKNPYREWIGAQIRADFFGYAAAGDPELAAYLAYKDASISHTKNGIYGEMFFAALIAAVAAENDIAKAIQRAACEIPAKSRLYVEIERVLKMHASGKTFEDVIGYVHKTYDERVSHHAVHTISNAMIVVAAVLFARDFEDAICLAVGAGYDTDCNGATAGSIMGMLGGFDSIPEKWYAPFGLNVASSIAGYARFTIDELTQRTLVQYEKTMDYAADGKKSKEVG